MPELQTLDELKAENASAEQETTEETATEVVESTEEAVTETNEELEQIAESNQEEAEEEVTEVWMQEEGSSDGENTFNDHDVAAMRRKMKAKATKKLEEKDDEIEQLRAELNQLKGGASQPKQLGAKPKLEDFDYDEDKYEQALDKWHDAKIEQKLSKREQASVQNQQQEQLRKQVEKEVDSHYERAAVLAKDSGIDATVYQNADLKVRQAFERVAPGQGDSVYEGIITSLGEGSEKVGFYLGRNDTELNKVLAMADNPYRLMAYLGELKGKLKQPVKKVSKASKPAKKAEGESTGSISNFKKRYDKAKDGQERFKIKREARKAGIDTRQWYR